jgi:AcrR family transcriptional regulator
MMNLQVVDGRTIRREKSRQRIIDAVIRLVNDGKDEPTAESVAKLAGVTMRTVFRHFDDMEALHREIVADLQVQTDALRVAYDPSRDWREQFDELILRRTGIFEKYMPQILWAQALRLRSPAIEEDVQVYFKRMRESLKVRLPKKFIANADAFSSIEVVLGWEVWNRLRRDQKLSVKKATRVIQNLVEVIFKDAGL